MLNAYILAANPGPARWVGAVIQMEENAVVSADSSVGKRRDLQGELIHLLERESGDSDVGSHSPSMFAIWDASYLLIVGGTAVAVVHDDFLSGARTQLFEGVDEATLDFQFAATVAGKLGLREVLAQIAHLVPLLWQRVPELEILQP